MSFVEQFQTSFNPANLSAFNVLETAERTPVVQADFVYGINSQIGATTTSGTGATVDTSSNRLRVQSGTSSTGYAYFISKRPAKYRAGQGIIAECTPIFTTGVANNIQLHGVGLISANVATDGYFWGYNGTTLGIAHYVRGVASWTSVASWNGNYSGAGFTWDPTKGTPTMIKYPYLGYGNITFWIQKPETSEWVLVHTIKYANTVNSTQLANPSLNCISGTWNSGNTTNITMYCGSIGVFVSGVRNYVGNPRWTMDNLKASITTETNLLTFRNATTYNTVINRTLMRVLSVSFSSDNNAGVSRFRFKVNATLGGTPLYTPISGSTADSGVTITSGNSTMSYDTAGTTVTSGASTFYQFGHTITNPGNDFIDLINHDIFLAPGDILTVSGTSSASATLSCVINWVEDI